jgi:hypothetical protein
MLRTDLYPQHFDNFSAPTPRHLSLFLFMGFCKRGSELSSIEDRDAAVAHRASPESYTRELLVHLITLSAAIAVASFRLYSTSERTVASFRTD